MIVNNAIVSIGVLISAGLNLRAGDAVVIGYNSDGVWTAVTYYCSSTAKGGRDYKDAAEAQKEALRDLRRRAGDKLANASVLASSDVTGYAAVARGKTDAGKDVNVVGYGKSQPDADKKAMADLNAAGAGANQKIVYRYFSYGADSK
jgi:hypothetical protein